jgi:hypothetical protein
MPMKPPIHRAVMLSDHFGSIGRSVQRHTRRPWSAPPVFEKRCGTGL